MKHTLLALAPIAALFVTSFARADAVDHEPESEECPEGEAQSPIDLPLRPFYDELPDLVPEYLPSAVSVHDTGRAIQYAYEPGSLLRVGAATYELVQLHFHVHSEHAIGGVLSPVELHLVHRDAGGQLLVLGVLLEEGDHNRTLDDADWTTLPDAEHPDLEDPAHSFNAADLLPGGPTYRYTGSLTAPPCTGGVSWIVFRRKLQLDRAQLALLRARYDRNFRAVQPLSAREIVFGE